MRRHGAMRRQGMCRHNASSGCVVRECVVTKRRQGVMRRQGAMRREGMCRHNASSGGPGSSPMCRHNASSASAPNVRPKLRVPCIYTHIITHTYIDNYAHTHIYIHTVSG